MKLEEIIERLEKAKEETELLPTGFPGVDDVLDGGFLRKELVVMGGFTGSGKSFLAGQVMLNLLLNGFRVGYFSLELGSESLVSRFIGSIAHIKPNRIRTGWLTKDEFSNRNKAIAKLLCYSENLSIYDDIYSLDEILKVLNKERLDFVVIDFIQNVISLGEQYERLSKVSIELQRAAKSANTCIFVVSQLSNRAAREGSDSGFLEFKGSGTIAQVCDIGFWLTQVESENFKLTLRKNRRGISGISFDLTFEAPGGGIHES